jgi:ABC-type uncharacterized transport system ATPase subunit
MTEEITLRVENVTKRFGDFTAVDELSFVANKLPSFQRRGAR